MKYPVYLIPSLHFESMGYHAAVPKEDKTVLVPLQQLDVLDDENFSLTNKKGAWRTVDYINGIEHKKVGTIQKQWTFKHD